MPVTREENSMEIANCGQWSKMSIDSSGRISAGGDEFREMLNGRRFAELLNDESRCRFEYYLEGPAIDCECATFVTADNMKLEMMIVPLGSGHRVIYRSIEKCRVFLDKLSVLYSHFLLTPTAICITDVNGNIREANSSFLEMYGYTHEEVVGRTPRILKSGLQSPQTYRELWQQITDPSVEQWCGEITNRKKNGEELTVHLTVSAVRDFNGRHTGFIATTVDLTGQKRIERDLEDANSKLVEINQFKSDLMAITSHDLKSPLNAIISRAGMLLDISGELTRDGQEEQLNKIIESGYKMSAFIDELLDLEKMESGRLKLTTARMHLDTLLQTCVETNLPSAVARNITIDLQFSGEMEPVRADIMKLEQVFNNIISNAIKFTPKGGLIKVSCHGCRGGTKTISIVDNGPGIPESHLPLIFDRYYQVRHDGRAPGRVYGAGLGLSIARNIMELHGGSVSAANRPEGGCEFVLVLPARGEARSGVDISALVIDPQQKIYSSIEPSLRQKEVSCYITRTIHESVRVLRREQPEIIFIASSACCAELDECLTAWSGSSLKVMVEDLIMETVPEYLPRVMTLPVMDIEIFEILSEVFFADAVYGGEGAVHDTDY